MKIAIGCLALFLTVVIGLLAGGQRTAPLAEVRGALDDGPEFVAREFLKLIETENAGGELSKFISSVPPEYFEAKKREVTIYSQLTGKVILSPDPEQVSKETSPIAPEIPTLSVPSREVSLIEYDVKQLAADSAYLEGVRRVWVNGGESRVRVVLRSKTNPHYRAVKDVLLSKSSGSWKVFMVAGVGIVNVYGFEEPEVRSNQDALTESTQ